MPITPVRGKQKIYLTVNFWGAKHGSRGIASLVARAFIGEPPGKDFNVGFRNRNSRDCRAWNLQWVPKSQVMRAAYRNGERHHNVKILEEQAMCIRDSEKPGEYMAKKYGISPSMVSMIRRGKRWRHLLNGSGGNPNGL